MDVHYLGTLAHHDPLYGFLVQDVLNLGADCPQIDVCALDETGTVYQYTLHHGDVNVVGKFYGRKWIHGSQNGERQLRAELMGREFDNLLRVRKLGLRSPPSVAVRPLAVNESLGCVLIEEFVPGTTLERYIREAVEFGHDAPQHFFFDGQGVLE